MLGLCLVAGVVVAGMTFPAAAGLGLVSNDAGDSVNSVSTDLVDGPLPQTTTVTDTAGTPIARFFEPNQNRQALTPDQISPAMKAAIVAIEDRRFYQHQGVDWQGTMRAVIANSASGDVVQGASTLTQQYVKNYFLYVAAKTETERLKATEQTPARKLKEAQIALQMERSAEQGGDPHPLPEHRLVRQRGGRGRRGGAHLLQHHPRPADGAPGGVARRHGAQHHGDRPGHQPARPRWSGATS